LQGPPSGVADASSCPPAAGGLVRCHSIGSFSVSSDTGSEEGGGGGGGSSHGNGCGDVGSSDGGGGVSSEEADAVALGDQRPLGPAQGPVSLGDQGPLGLSIGQVAAVAAPAAFNGHRVAAGVEAPAGGEAWEAPGHRSGSGIGLVKRLWDAQRMQVGRPAVAAWWWHARRPPAPPAPALPLPPPPHPRCPCPCPCSPPPSTPSPPQVAPVRAAALDDPLLLPSDCRLRQDLRTLATGDLQGEGTPCRCPLPLPPPPPTLLPSVPLLLGRDGGVAGRGGARLSSSTPPPRTCRLPGVENQAGGAAAARPAAQAGGGRAGLLMSEQGGGYPQISSLPGPPLPGGCT
jgi:hypothetical protein